MVSLCIMQTTETFQTFYEGFHSSVKSCLLALLKAANEFVFSNASFSLEVCSWFCRILLEDVQRIIFHPIRDLDLSNF